MKIYVSHPIRGVAPNPSPEYIALNNRIAKIFGAALRVRYPQHEFYVPAENEEFVALAYEHDYLDEGEILGLDCKIIDSKDGVIFYKHEYRFSNGMLRELQHAVDTNTPNATVSSVSEVAWLPELEDLLKCN